MQKMRFQLSLDIVHCDGFVAMPATAQALYVQIVSVCDDEGFTSQIELCKFLAKASDSDVRELVERDFILQVGERNVTVVKHWKMNNYLHDGKCTPSKFAERALVYVKQNGNYTLNPEEGTPLCQSIMESKRNVNGMKPESFRNTSESFGNTSPSRVGQGARAPRTGTAHGIQTKPNQSITPSKDSVIHTEQTNPIHSNTNTNTRINIPVPSIEGVDEIDFDLIEGKEGEK